jgi:hypothetical protein
VKPSFRDAGSRVRAVRRAVRRKRDERGQGLVEFTMILPVFMLLLLIMLEFGFAFNHKLTIGLASREAARTGSALSRGGVADCSGGNDPGGVDQQVIAAASRILKSPGSDVIMADIASIRIYKANSSGAQIGSFVNVWTYTPGAGPDIDDGSSVDRLDFSQGSVGWPACSRVNTVNPDSIGVKIIYSYRLETPLRGLVQALGGTQATTLQMDDQTVMALNPTN